MVFNLTVPNIDKLEKLEKHHFLFTCPRCWNPVIDGATCSCGLKFQDCWCDECGAGPVKMPEEFMTPCRDCGSAVWW